MNLYSLLKPLFFNLDPEKAHLLVHRVGGRLQQHPALLERWAARYRFQSPLLEQTVFGVRFANPIGLAAGFDKNGDLVDFMSSLGFGFIEVGSITNHASEGNPRPRLFRLPDDQALINRMGLNNIGPQGVREHLSRRRSVLPVGVNIAKTNRPDLLGLDAADDMLSCYRQLAGVGSYTAFNVSCPNTKDGKTFEEPASLRRLLMRIQETRRELSVQAPVLVKLSSDLNQDELRAAVEVCEEQGVDGYVLVNTSMMRDGLMTSMTEVEQIGRGGLSGRPLQRKALEKVRAVYRLVGRSKPIIGVGGVDSAAYAYQLIKSGASLLQLYTGLIYQGPALISRLNRGLEQHLRRDGMENIAQAVGVEAPLH